jgi:ubiquitin C-terminal hydrolase
MEHERSVANQVQHPEEMKPVEGEDVLLHTHVDHRKTDQSGSVSAVGYIGKRLAHWKTRKNHKAKQESSYVDRPVASLHKESRIGGSFQQVPSWRGQRFSSFKGIAPSNSMEQTPVSEPVPPTTNTNKDDKGVTGLANMRNTCYMNAALQAIRHNTEISAFFLEGRFEQWVQKKESSPKVELVRGYADLLKSLWSGSRPAYVRPSGFLQTMIPAAQAAGFDQFAIPLQHDAHEFLVFLMDQLHEGMAEEVNIEIHRPPPQTSRDKAIQGALEAWKRYFGKQYSPLTEMIYGLMRITLTCKGCGNFSDNWETFNCLKVPIPQRSAETDTTPPGLKTMFAEEFKEEEIEGYACDHCKPERTTAVRKARIWRLPRMIALVFKRFTMDGRKIHTRISFPQEEPITFGTYFSEDSPEQSRNQAYECFAVVDHHGVAGGGHYIAQAKSPLSDKWHVFDDETASPISEPNFGESTYIVFLKPSMRAAPA